jgi:hypothetical protein
LIVAVGRQPTPAIATTGNSSPLLLCIVISFTLSAVASYLCDAPFYCMRSKGAWRAECLARSSPHD